jgi:hypothetical protein
MDDIRVNDHTIPVEAKSHESHDYYLKIRFSDEGTPDDMNRTVGMRMGSLLSDVDLDDTEFEPDDLSTAMGARAGYGEFTLSPRGRRDVTQALIQMAVDVLVDKHDFDGDIEYVTSVEVEERTTIRDTPHDEKVWEE